MVYERSIGSCIAKVTNAVKKLPGKGINKDDSIVVTNKACGVNGGQAKYDLFIFDDRSTGFLMSGWMLAQQTDELQAQTIEEIKAMGICNVTVLQGQTESMMRSICGPAADAVMTPWQLPYQVLQGDAKELTGQRLRIMLNIQEEQILVMRSCVVNVMEVSDAGMVSGFYVCTTPRSRSWRWLLRPSKPS